MFEYVASGTTHLGMNDKNILQDHIVRDMKKMYETMNHTFVNSKFSLLFNAYSEHRIGQILFNNFKDSLYDLHSDSGGLQIITQGKTITTEEKYKIYGRQRSLSTTAMSFDEIPLKLQSSQSSMLDVASRCVDHENFDEYAINSGKNLNEQLDFFRNNDNYEHQTKPLLIIHGNCMDSSQRWLDIMISQISNDNINNIGGLAIAGSSIGFGELESLQISALPYFLDIPDCIPKKYHILGMGSIPRIQPTIIFNHVFNEKYHISYDSTTQSNSITFGKYLTRNCKCTTAPRNANHIFKKIYDSCHERFDYVDVTADKFIKAAQSNRVTWEESQGNDDWYSYYCSRLMYPLDQMYSFINRVEEMKNDLKVERYDKFDDIQLKLLTCRDLHDYNDFLIHAKRHMKSKNIKNCVSCKPEFDLGI